MLDSVFTTTELEEIDELSNAFDPGTLAAVSAARRDPENYPLSEHEWDVVLGYHRALVRNSVETGALARKAAEAVRASDRLASDESFAAFVGDVASLLGDIRGGHYPTRGDSEHVGAISNRLPRWAARRLDDALSDLISEAEDVAAGLQRRLTVAKPPE